MQTNNRRKNFHRSQSFDVVIDEPIVSSISLEIASESANMRSNLNHDFVLDDQPLERITPPPPKVTPSITPRDSTSLPSIPIIHPSNPALSAPISRRSISETPQTSLFHNNRSLLTFTQSNDIIIDSHRRHSIVPVMEDSQEDTLIDSEQEDDYVVPHRQRSKTYSTGKINLHNEDIVIIDGVFDSGDEKPQSIESHSIRNRQFNREDKYPISRTGRNSDRHNNMMKKTNKQDINKISCDIILPMNPNNIHRNH